MIFKRVSITSKKKQKNLSARTPDKKMNTVTSTKTKDSIFFKRVSVNSKKNNTHNDWRYKISQKNTEFKPYFIQWCQ